MRIVLSGIETNNKGAELMLYAILQEIERRYPDAEVYVPIFAIKQGLGYVKTNISLKEKPYACLLRAAAKLHIAGILRRLHLPHSFLYDIHAVPHADYFIDASGFAFSDQWNPDKKRVEYWEKILEGYKEIGTKIIFLPQAFGPVSKTNTKKLIALLSKNADIIMPREKVSMDYLRQCHVDEKKLHQFTDFTSLVKGTFPVGYEHLKDGVCVIPNLRMIDKGSISLENYLDILSGILDISLTKGHKVYLLNHEGKGDKDLAYLCKKRLNKDIEVVTGLNALEVKGLISTSYLCISSRFHGVASALNSTVPCLATSWSHKYKELFLDYGMDDCVLNLSNKNSIISKVTDFLDKEKNQAIRKKLYAALPQIQKETEDMWNKVWSL